MAAPTVLVADDDPVARDLLVEVLTRQGYRARAAAGGRNAFAWLKANRSTWPSSISACPTWTA
jgi:CheY-like chemotaxis protein